MSLRKDISKFSLLFTSVGGIVGSGWLLGPFYTAKVAGPAAILSWMIGGFLMIIVALTFAELATSLPVAGGMVRFAQFTHGRFASFTMAFIAWLAAVMVSPIETMAAIQYAGNYLPLLVYTNHGSAHLTHDGIFAAMCVMLLMCLVNYFSVKYFAKSNSILVTWKLAIPLITIFVLLSHRFHVTQLWQFGGFAPYGLKGMLTALPTAGVIFSFIGYSPAIQLAEEAKNPQRAIPFAIIGAIILAIILYVCIELAFIGAIDPAHLVHGWQHLTFAGDTGPVAGLVSALGVAWLLKIIYFDSLVSPAGTAYIYTAATARINIAMSKNGYMPKWMQTLNKHRSPAFAILANFVVGMIFFLPFPGWQSMVSFIVSCFVLAYAIGPISCASLRRLHPDLKRPFKVPCYILFCLVAFYICNLIVYWTGWQVVWKMMLTIIIGYAVLFVNQCYTRQPLNLRNGIWVFPYLAGLAIISYLGAFGGGHHVIKFGGDFVVIGIFSIVIYAWALYSASDTFEIDVITAKE